MQCACINNAGTEWLAVRQSKVQSRIHQQHPHEVYIHRKLLPPDKALLCWKAPQQQDIPMGSPESPQGAFGGSSMEAPSGPSWGPLMGASRGVPRGPSLQSLALRSQASVQLYPLSLVWAPFRLRLRLLLLLNEGEFGSKDSVPATDWEALLAAVGVRGAPRAGGALKGAPVPLRAEIFQRVKRKGLAGRRGPKVRGFTI